MARIKFDLSLGSLHGAVQLCLPCRSLAGLATLPLSLEPGFANDVAGISSPQQPIDVVVTLAEMRVTAEQLAALQPGDILATDRSCRGTLSVEADGVRLLRGRPGTSAGRKAVRIEQRVPRR
jgi:flagellar motor switch protein FliM